MHPSRLIARSSAIQVRCATLLEHMHSDAALVCMLYRYDTRSHAGDALSAVPYFAGVMTEYVYIYHMWIRQHVHYLLAWRKMSAQLKDVCMCRGVLLHVEWLWYSGFCRFWHDGLLLISCSSSVCVHCRPVGTTAWRAVVLIYIYIYVCVCVIYMWYIYFLLSMLLLVGCACTPL